MDSYQQYIHKSRYARWREDDNRRETWAETVQRYIDFWKGRKQIDEATGKKLYDAIYNLEVMPSMRCLMTAGVALDRDNMAGFNCSYIAVDHIRVFDEILYVLMCGTGVGFSVERQSVNKLPEVAEEFNETDTTIHVSDSKIGWAKAFRELVSLLYSGQVPSWDVSKLRSKGERLKTFGGRSSGPDPLVALFDFTISTFKGAAGRKLTSIECHDIVCKIAEIVVVGGVRRSALISLSNLSDDRMRHAKSGNWWETDTQRALANNSAVYDERPDFETFLEEWTALYKSKAGERGIFSRKAAKKQSARHGRRDIEHDFGTNPCSEIILRSAQVCNLSEIVVRSTDSMEDLMRKAKIATILGTLQSSLTDFRYVRNIWKKNTQEECLLGVSMTGIMDHAVLSGRKKTGAWFDQSGYDNLPEILEALKTYTVTVNKEWSTRLGINQSTAITAVKPSGTVSQLVDSASGIHARFSPQYIRTVRSDGKDPISAFLKDAGVPWEKDVMNEDNYVFSFPIKAPKGSTSVDDLNVQQQLDLWEVYQNHYCEHKPSVTIYYSDEEFLAAGQWLWDRLDSCSGISFLPRSDHVYKQAPYTAITEQEYDEALAKMPETINWDDLGKFETEDTTTGTQELACVAGQCEI
jgi:ribonucleoside-triphosphate reductase (thioredoxin)